MLKCLKEKEADMSQMIKSNLDKEKGEGEILFLFSYFKCYEYCHYLLNKQWKNIYCLYSNQILFYDANFCDVAMS